MPGPGEIAARIARSLPKRAPGPLLGSWEPLLGEAEPYARDSRLAPILRRPPGERRSLVREASASACGPGVSGNVFLECVEPGEAEALGAPGALGYVPVAIKDNMDHPRFSTRLGAPYAQYKPSHMDPLTSRLVAAGAAVIGKTSMHELALGTTNVNPHYGTPENPACPGRIPGGSSGGSAAAVAAGTVPLATGNDAGGSVRLPAAYTGVTGFKPSRGYLPGAGLPGVESLAAPGLIAATPLDVVLAVEAIRPGEAARILAAAGELRGSRLGPRVLVPVDLLERAEPSVEEAFRDALEALEAAGWRSVRARLALPREAENARVAATLLEALQDLQGLYEAHRQEMGEDIRFLLDIASHMPPWALASARRLLERVRASVRGRLEAYDAILLPTAPQEPPRLDEADWRLSASTRLIEYTAPLNTLDLPAISIPAGPRLPCGAPLGLQLASAHGDAYTLALALEAWRILTARA